MSSLTDNVDQAAEDDGPLVADHVCEITSQDGTDESTSRENGDDERGVAGADLADTAGGVEALGTDGALDLLDKEGRVEHTVDVSRIITWEELLFESAKVDVN